MSDFDKTVTTKTVKIDKCYLPGNDVSFDVDFEGGLQVSFPYGGADPNCKRVYHINKANVRKLAEYLREVE